MTPESDEGGDPRGALASPAATAAGRDALRAGTVVPIALGLMLGIAYLGYAHLQRQIEAQRAGFVTQLQPMKQKIQEMAAAQSQTEAEVAKLAAHFTAPFPKSEIQGLQNHVENFRVQAKRRKNKTGKWRFLPVAVPHDEGRANPLESTRAAGNGGRAISRAAMR